MDAAFAAAVTGHKERAKSTRALTLRAIAADAQNPAYRRTPTAPARRFLLGSIHAAGKMGRMSETALDLLHRIFGHREFRGEQAQIVEQVAGGGDALVLMPTGGGKSLCYQLPALLRDGCGIVVSPLIALMQDQVEALRQLGVSAAYLNSSLDAAVRRRGRTQAARRRARPALRRARTPADAALPVAARPRAHRAVRHRRGALRLAMGPRLPPGIPRTHGAARALAAGAAHRAHRHRGRAHAPGNRRTPGTGRRAPLRQFVRPPQHPLSRGAEGQRAAAAARLPAGAPRPERHRLRLLAQARGQHRRTAARRRASTPCPTTPAWTLPRAPPTSAASCRRTAW